MTSRNVIIIAVLLVIAVAAWGFLTMPDHRTFGQRVGDAADALPNGVTSASRALQPRTPGQKLGDAVKDTGQDIKNNTSSSGNN